MIFFMSFTVLTLCNFLQSVYQPANALNKKYISWQASNSYVFRHRGAILREASLRKEYKSNTVI
jgi:hypothetical protein